MPARSGAVPAGSVSLFPRSKIIIQLPFTIRQLDRSELDRRQPALKRTGKQLRKLYLQVLDLFRRFAAVVERILAANVLPPLTQVPANLHTGVKQPVYDV